MTQWSSIFKAQKSTYCQILCYFSAKFFNILNATKLGRTELQEYEPREATEIFDAISGEWTEFEWNIFPGFTTLQLCDKISILLSSLRTNTRIFHRKNSIYVDVQRHLLWQKRKQRWMFKKCRICEGICEKIWMWVMVIFWTSFWEKWYPSENSPHGAWDHVAEDMLLKFAESGHPIVRSTTPLSRRKLKSKGKGEVSIHFAADQDTVDQFVALFSLSIS